MRRRTLLFFVVAVTVATVAPTADTALAQEEPKPLVPSDPQLVPDRLPNGGVVPGQIIVKYEEGTNPAEEAAVRRQEDLDKEEELSLIDAEVVEVEGRSTGAALRDLNRRPDVEYAELDYIYHPFGYTDEPRFGELWGLDNTGQLVNGSPGIANVDVNGKEASAITQGDPNLVVAVIDTGVDFSHPDLEDRAWKNPGESGVDGDGNDKATNGVDDDGNGYVDDVNGWDFYYNDKTVHDPGEDAHGTHVSGTIAASANDQGVVGVAPNVQIMSLKFLGPQGGFTSDAIEALGYAKSKGVKISNNSWGGGAYSQALKDAIDASGLFVAAAGNSANNNDSNPRYPASYDSPNILSVAAINNQGNLASFSNYGATSVDISAPGVGILSSVAGIRDIPAAALSSVGLSGGKAVTGGFGADEIGDSAQRASFMSKAFAAVGRGSEQVVLVDDDQSDVGRPDVGATLSAAIQSATGSAPQEIDVSANSNGPDLSQLSGKTVVWATGQAWNSGSAGATLTTTDQQTLTGFLDGGGKLVLTGMDVLYRIEGSPFVTGTLKLSVQSDLGSSINATTFSGSSGTAFAGESYTFNSSTTLAPYHDKVASAASSSTVIQGIYPVNVPPSWQDYSGTSMAAPHATGVAALAASMYPSLLSDSTMLKKAVMDSGKPVSSTAGKTVTGDMVDAEAAILGVSNVSPAQGAKGVLRSTSVTATFLSEMDPTTLNTSTFTLTKQGSTTPVEATVSYDAATKTATLDPSENLEWNNAYTATIKGGPNGAKDAAGNPLAADKVWIFSTVENIATIVPYLDTGYKYKVVSHGVGSGFEQPGFDDSAFSTGAAGFGSVGSGCLLTDPANNMIGTDWPLNTDILVRKHFVLPNGTKNLKVGVAIDNDVQVFLNGQDISGGVRSRDGCAQRDSFIFTAPDSVLNAGGTNTLAVRGIDRGGLSYLDLKVTATVPPMPTSTAASTPQANSAGWNNSDVTVTLTATDPDGSSDVDKITYSASGAQVVSETDASGSSVDVALNNEGTTTLTYYATDKAGNVEFPAKTFTVKLDKSAPTLDTDNTDGSDGITPDHRQTGVRRNIMPRATFSDEMDPASLRTSAKLYRWDALQKTWQQVPARVSVVGKTATLDPYPSDPTRLLAANTRFKVTITTGAKNLAGIPMSSPKSWSFTTGSR